MAKGKGKPARKVAKAKHAKAVKAKAVKPTAARSKDKAPTVAKPSKSRSKSSATWSTPSATRNETKQWTAKRVKPVRRGDAIPTTCPICGSKRLDVRPADGVGKAAAKVVAGVVVPLVVRVHPEIDCLSCGWRSEATT